METEPNMGRRNFIKNIGIAAAGTMLSPETLFKKTKLENKSEEFVAKQILICKEIIEKKEYGKILDNPYLVSALYYSEEYGKSLKEGREVSGQKKIASEIYPLIKRDFRENYIKMLEKSISENEKSRGSNFESVCPPLEEMNISENTEENHKNALDIFSKTGFAVSAMSGGIVVLSENSWRENDEFSTSSNLGGNTIIIYNPVEKAFYRYAHLETTAVVSKDVITSGANIGTLGNSGANASKRGHGEHLHIEIHKYDKEAGLMESIQAKEIKDRLAKI